MATAYLEYLAYAWVIRQASRILVADVCEGHEASFSMYAPIEILGLGMHLNPFAGSLATFIRTVRRVLDDVDELILPA
jgi:hypothetical protein